MAKDVAKVKDQGALAISDFSDFDKPGITGLENVQSKDVLIPRLTILQALSPQISPNKPDFISGAKQGDICDTGLGEVWPEIHILPCFFSTVYLEWHPRESGKGLAANHGQDASILRKTTRDEKGRYVLPGGNYVAETATYFVLNLSAGGRRSFIPLTSTQLKASRRWMTAITSERLPRPDGTEFMPPIFFRSWLVKPVMQQKGNDSWWGWNFIPDASVLEIDPTKKLLLEAKDFAKQAAEGAIGGDVGDIADEGSAPSSSSRDDDSEM